MNNSNQTIDNIFESFSGGDLIKNIKNSFLSEFGIEVYNSWIKDIEFVSLGDFEIILACRNSFIRDFIKSEYLEGFSKIVNGEKKWLRKGIFNILNDYFPKLIKVELLVNKKYVSAEKSVKNDNVVSYSENDNLYNVGTELNKNYTFENFVVGDSNKIAYETTKYVAENENINCNYNPLFLYGPVGIGKSHLLQSIAWSFKNNFKNKKIIYISAEKFMFLFVESIKNDDINSFKSKFRNIDCLIVDDIQFIVGKEKTQKEFFYTFEALVSEGKQIILACDKSPVNLNLDDKLKSRLSGGMIVDIKENDFDLRNNIIKQKSFEYDLNLDCELMEYLGNLLTLNTREIEGCLKRLKLNENIMKTKITKNTIDDILKDNIQQAKQIISVDDILEKTAAFFDVSIVDMKSEKRLKQFVLPRHIAMYISRKLTKKSFPDIAKKFNGKNHATIINAVKKIEDKITNEPEIANFVNKIIAELR